jgi:hypothetical protein
MGRVGPGALYAAVLDAMDLFREGPMLAVLEWVARSPVVPSRVVAAYM